VDLRARHPQKHQQLLELWRKTRREQGILLPVDL
jgi:hypothetical protein